MVGGDDGENVDIGLTTFSIFLNCVLYCSGLFYDILYCFLRFPISNPYLILYLS